MAKIIPAVAAFGFMALIAGQAPASAGTVPMTPIPGKQAAPSDSAQLLKVDWYGSHCYRWRHICADRWGWRTRNFFVCLRRHDC